MTSPERQQKGQSMVEFLIVAAALSAALFVPLPSGQNSAQTLASAIKGSFQAFSFFISLP
jgi:hypothetical protein